jgi:photosystem II stability/assembly factor-like uncharacterized protein
MKPKQHSNRLWCCLMMLFFVGVSPAQMKMPPELEQLLQGKTKVSDIKQTVEFYFKTAQARTLPGDSLLRRKYERQRKFWNRHFYLAESHTDSLGLLQNVSQRTLEALASEQQTTAISFGNWEALGPFNVDAGVGRVNRIAFHPTNANTIFAGTPQAGLWKTTNAGASWSCISNFLPCLGISGIVVHPQNPAIIYIATGDGDANTGGFTDNFGYIRYADGVYKTTDGGATWAKTAPLPITDTNIKRYVTYNLVASPDNPNILLVATSIGLYRTANGGASWSRCSIRETGSWDDDIRIWDVAFKPGDGNIAYITTVGDDGSEFHRSTDGGVTFPVTNTVDFSPLSFNQNAERIKIAVTPANPDYVYLLAGPGNIVAETFKGVWRSINNGQNFFRRSNTPDILGYDGAFVDLDDQNTYDLALAVSPVSANIIVTGGLVCWRSTNGGSDMDKIGDYWEDLDNSNFIHPDVHDLQYNPLDGKLWAATDGGVASSTDNGSNFTRHFNMQTSAFYRYKPSNQDNKRWGGTQDNGVIMQTSGLNYYEFDGGDGYDIMTDKSPAGNNNDDYWVLNKAIWTDGIADINITPDGFDEYFPNIDMCPNDEDIIYAGMSRINVSLNRGDDWFTPSINDANLLDASGNWCIATCPSNPSVVYAAGNRGNGGNIYRVVSANTENANVDRKGFAAARDEKITDIEVSSSNHNVVWITYGGFTNGRKVFRSTDGAQSWTNFSAGLPNVPANCLLLVGNILYLGNDIGVYCRNLAQDTGWTPFYNGMPRVPVTQMHRVYDIATQKFYIEASTFGRGLWRSEEFGACTATVTVSNTLQGQQFYQAGNTLNSTSVITGGLGTQVYHKAGNLVSLKPGFNARTGNNFRAFIEPCNTGMPQQNGKATSSEKTAKKTNPKPAPKKKS